MQTIYLILTVFLSELVGFAMGRIGDKYGGHLNVPDHWIYGLILMIIGLIYLEGLIAMLVIGLGFGHFLSDMDDFLRLKFWGPDLPHKWTFWNTD